MGAFFTNLQVRIAGDDAMPKVRAALERIVRPTDVGRTIVLAQSGEWVAILDEATDSGEADLELLGAAVSHELAAPVVTVRVHDSDILQLFLFENGEEQDRFDSRPDYFEEVDAETRASVAGRPARWASLLAPGATDAALALAFAATPVFCEEALRNIATLLGIAPGQILVGYRYAKKGKSPPRAVRVTFPATAKAAFEERKTGAPAFGVPWGHDRLPPVESTLMVGAPAKVSARVTNRGGAGTGVTVIVEGSAVERGLVRVKSVSVVWSVGERPSFAQTETLTVEGSRVFARLPEAVIPAGTVTDLETLMHAYPQRAVALMYMCDLQANVDLEVLAPGAGDVRITIGAAAAPEGGATSTSQVVVEAAAPRPLHAMSELYPHLLAPLTERSTVTMLVAFDLPRAEAARFAAATIATWRTHLERIRTLRSTVFHRDPGQRPTVGKKIPWDDLERLLRDENVISVEDPEGRAGFTFGTTILDNGSPQPSLALWLPDDAPRAALDFMHAAAGRAMLEMKGFQACVAYWGWRVTSTLGTTPYETACGIHGDTNLERAWLERWLRVVAAGDVWLGPALASRVDRARLAAAAAVDAHGGCLRVRIEDDPASIRRAEEALREILPQGAT